jgi:hypothetical protein
MLFEETAPRLSGDKWGRGSKRTAESAREHVRLGTRHSRFYDFGRNKTEIFKLNALTNELCNRRTRVIHALAGGARVHEQNCGFSPSLLGQKARRGG